MPNGRASLVAFASEGRAACSGEVVGGYGRMAWRCVLVAWVSLIKRSHEVVGRGPTGRSSGMVGLGGLFKLRGEQLSREGQMILSIRI